MYLLTLNTLMPKNGHMCGNVDSGPLNGLLPAVLFEEYCVHLRAVWSNVADLQPMTPASINSLETSNPSNVCTYCMSTTQSKGIFLATPPRCLRSSRGDLHAYIRSTYTPRHATPLEWVTCSIDPHGANGCTYDMHEIRMHVCL